MNKSCDIKTRLLEILFIVVSVLGFMFCIYAVRELYPFGAGTIAYSDMSQQTIPFYYYLYDMLHGGGLPYFTWQVGTGSNMLGVMSQFSMLSPFNLLFYFTARENILNFVNIVIVIKAAIAAVSMYIYASSFDVKSHVRILSSLLYAFGAGTIIYYVLGYNMDIAILVPFIMLGIKKMKEDEKSWLFILAMTLCLVINIYYAAMVIIFVVISSVLQFVLLDDEETRGRGAYLLIRSLVISALIGAVVWLPSLICIGNSARLDSSVTNLFGTYMNALRVSQSDVYMKKMMLVNITLPVAVIISAPVVAKIKGKKVFDKLNIYGLIMLVLMALSIIVPATEVLWHGGSRMGWPVRFIFVVTFAFLDFWIMRSEKNEEEDFENDEELHVGLKVLAGVICAVITVAAVFKFSKKYLIEILNGINNVQRDFIVFAVICFVCYMLIMCLVKKKFQSILLALVVCIEVSFNASIWIAPAMQETNPSVQYIKDAGVVFEGFECADRLDRVKDAKVSLNSNYAFVGGVNSVANFIHTIDADVLSYMKELGYPSTWTRILDNSGTLLSDSMINMKYNLSDGVISENPYTFPYVMAVENMEQPAEEYNRFARLNNIYKGITGRSEDLFERIDEVSSEGASLDIKGRKIVYMYAENAGALAVKVNDAYVMVPDLNNPENTTYHAMFNNNIISLGSYADEQINITFEGENIAYEQIRLAVMDEDMFAADVAKLNEENGSKLGFFETTKAGVSFIYTADKQETLMLPVVMSDGWKVKVNGEKVNPVKLYGGMLGVEVMPGQNDVSVYFVPKGILAGLIMMVIGIILAIVFMIIDRNTFEQPKLEKASYLVFVAGSAVAGVLLFVIPLVAMVIY